MVVSRSTFDTTRFQDLPKNWKYLSSCGRPRFPLLLVSFSHQPSFLLHSFPLSFFSIRPSFERNYLLPRGLSRSKPAEENGFSHFPIMQIPFKKETTAGCIDGGRRGLSLWIQIVAGSRRSSAWEEDISITPQAQDEFLPQG